MHDRLQNPLDSEHQKPQRSPQKDRHDAVSHKAIGNDKKRDNPVRQQLQQGKHQRVHVVHVGGNAPLYDSRIRIQEKFIIPAQIIPHHALRGCELIPVYKTEGQLLL